MTTQHVQASCAAPATIACRVHAFRLKSALTRQSKKVWSRMHDLLSVRMHSCKAAASKQTSKQERCTQLPAPQACSASDCFPGEQVEPAIELSCTAMWLQTPNTPKASRSVLMSTAPPFMESSSLAKRCRTPGNCTSAPFHLRLAQPSTLANNPHVYLHRDADRPTGNCTNQKSTTRFALSPGRKTDCIVPRGKSILKPPSRVSEKD